MNVDHLLLIQYFVFSSEKQLYESDTLEENLLKRMFWSTVPEVPELRVEVGREGVVAPRVDVAPDVRHPDVVASVRQDQRCNRSNNNGDENNLAAMKLQIARVH